ncbi:TOPRIM nucleotidyl transferase/hydrolase domain-containing protein [Rhizobium lemnae]|uniref:TOPRIM nucleotidyl transferase/hydrolase domain-containing protein n=1 Tax=Rhizobium lemnae TaxID=1214924 RepID=A0ABV8E9V7_9HYPH|nr:TOPRIM nucleotidyl transferase/hydrolase domain-containing protein [Rhizobium lemnae]
MIDTNSQIYRDYHRLRNAPSDADAIWKRKRGFDFERLLNAMLQNEKLEPRTSYKSLGEQIDGSFFLDGSVFLLEAKWHADPLPASTLYQFKGKVDGKLIGTIGIFISMSGYSEDAVDALSLGKTLNLILFDGRDMDAVFELGLGFQAVLKRKLREAAEAGIVYSPAEVEIVKRSGTNSAAFEFLRYDPISGGLMTSKPVTHASPDLVIVCEGDTDREVLAALSQRILDNHNSQRSIQIITAMGKHAVTKVTKTFKHVYPPETKVLLVVDGDGDPDSSREMLEQEVSLSNWTASIPNPGLEVWFGLEPLRMRRQSMVGRMEQYLSAVGDADINQLRNSHTSFEDFYNAVIGQ